MSIEQESEGIDGKELEVKPNFYELMRELVPDAIAGYGLFGDDEIVEVGFNPYNLTLGEDDRDTTQLTPEEQIFLTQTIISAVYNPDGDEEFNPDTFEKPLDEEYGIVDNKSGEIQVSRYKTPQSMREEEPEDRYLYRLRSTLPDGKTHDEYALAPKNAYSKD